MDITKVNLAEMIKAGLALPLSSSGGFMPGDRVTFTYPGTNKYGESVKRRKYGVVADILPTKQILVRWKNGKMDIFVPGQGLEFNNGPRGG